MMLVTILPEFPPMRCLGFKMHRPAWALAAVCLAVGLPAFGIGFAQGQVACDAARGPVQAPRCGDEYARPQCAPRDQPQRAPQSPPPGAFVAPPQSGVVQGASEGYGVRGLEVEFPALRLRLPTLTFPSLFATRDNAKMILDSAHAPYVAGNFAAFPVQPAYGGQPSQAPRAPDEPQQAPRDQPPYRSPQQAPGCQAQFAPQPSAERLAIEQRLRALEEAERRLGQKLQQVQQIYDQMAALEARRAALAAREGQMLQPVHYYQDAPEQPRRLPVTVNSGDALRLPPAEHGYDAPDQVSRLPGIEE